MKSKKCFVLSFVGAVGALGGTGGLFYLMGRYQWVAYAVLTSIILALLVSIWGLLYSICVEHRGKGAD